MSYRRTVQELIARYELEPSLRDVYVEGEFDRRIVGWFLQEKQVRNGVVYDIESVEAEPQHIRELRLNERSKRSRVISLAVRLWDNLEHPCLQATCLIDLDFDGALQVSYSLENLLVTDFAAMELYLFSDRVMSKFLSLVQPAAGQTVNEVLAKLAIVLRTLFVVRLVNELSELRCSYLDFERCLSLSHRDLGLDVEEYVFRYLSKSGKQWASRAFVEWVQQIESDPDYAREDRRRWIQGHDFLQLLAWYLWKRYGVSRDAAGALSRQALVGCIESRDLEDQPMFEALLRRVSS